MSSERWRDFASGLCTWTLDPLCLPWASQLLTTYSASENAWGEVGKNMLSKKIVHLAEVVLIQTSGKKEKNAWVSVVIAVNKRVLAWRGVVELCSYSKQAGRADCGKNNTEDCIYRSSDVQDIENALRNAKILTQSTVAEMSKSVSVQRTQGVSVGWRQGQ